MKGNTTAGSWSHGDSRQRCASLLRGNGIICSDSKTPNPWFLAIKISKKKTSKKSCCFSSYPPLSTQSNKNSQLNNSAPEEMVVVQITSASWPFKEYWKWSWRFFGEDRANYWGFIMKTRTFSVLKHLNRHGNWWLIIFNHRHVLNKSNAIWPFGLWTSPFCLVLSCGNPELSWSVSESNSRVWYGVRSVNCMVLWSNYPIYFHRSGQL